MNITKSPNVIHFKYNRSLGLYGGFEGVGSQYYNVLLMIEHLIGHPLSENEVVSICITKEIIPNWTKFIWRSVSMQYEWRFIFNEGWIHLPNDFVLKYKLQNGFYLKVKNNK